MEISVVITVILVAFWFFAIRSISNTDRTNKLFREFGLSSMDKDILSSKYKASQINEWTIKEHLAKISKMGNMAYQMVSESERKEMREIFIKDFMELRKDFFVQDKVDIEIIPSNSISGNPDFLSIVTKGDIDDIGVGRYLQALLYNEYAYKSFLGLGILVIKIRSWPNVYTKYILVDELE